jgi:hypothetical protein
MKNNEVSRRIYITPPPVNIKLMGISKPYKMYEYLYPFSLPKSPTTNEKPSIMNQKLKKKFSNSFENISI